MQGTATPAFVSVGSKLALKHRAVRKHTDSHLQVAVRFPVPCMGASGAAEPGSGQPGLHLATLGLTVAALGRSLLLQPGSWPALGSREGKPRTTTGSLAPAWPQLAIYLITLLGCRVGVTVSAD